MQKSMANGPFMAPPGPLSTVATIASVNTCNWNTTVDIPVTVQYFDNIGSMSLTFGYNTSQVSNPVILSRNAAFTGKWDDFVGTTNPDGTFAVSGFGALPADGVTLGTNAVLMTLRFTVVSSSVAASISFVENVQGSACEFTEVAPTYTPKTDVPQSLYYINGGVTFSAPSFVGAAATVDDLQISGSPGATFKWYTTETGGTALAAGTPLGDGTHDFWGSQVSGGNESITRVKVTATYDPTPCAPTATTPQSFVAPATVADLTTLTGSNVKWYTTASGGTYLLPETPLSDGIYYATQTIDCTESAARLAVTVVFPL
jgi:hypothetical protein